MNVPLKKLNFYYFGLILFLIFYLLIQYPRIYGIEEFNLIWMANSLREGALISDNSWFISPFSYFGLYPFSSLPIGIPIIFAGLISLLDFLSFGFLGLNEAILVYNVIYFLLIFKFSKNLAHTLFKEEWSRFIYITAIILSPTVVKSNMMTISNDLIILILTIILLDLNLKLLNHSIKKLKALIYICLCFVIGALFSTIWIVTTLTVILMTFSILLRKFNSLQYISIFLFLPISVLSFFFGIEFSINSIVLILISFPVEAGIISIIFPFGVIIVIAKLIKSFKNVSKIIIAEKFQNSNRRRISFNNNYYLLLFLVPFAFLISNIQFLIYIILPIIISFAIQGLIYLKDYIPNLSSIIKFRWIEKIKKIVSKRIAHEKEIWIILFSILIIFFSVGIEEINRISVNDRFYPWEEQYLTGEEIEIIDFYHDITVNGLIFVTEPSISARLGGIGFLPTFCFQTEFGKSLYYEFISSKEVHNNTEFLLYFDYTMRFFIFNGEEPILKVINSIKGLDLDMTEDYDSYLRYNIQYIITPKFEFQTRVLKNWPLIKSLNSSSLIFSNKPVFQTEHLLIWRIY